MKATRGPSADVLPTLHAGLTKAWLYDGKYGAVSGDGLLELREIGSAVLDSNDTVPFALSNSAGIA